MSIPIYVLTGFLSVGKTSFINQMVDNKVRKWNTFLPDVKNNGSNEQNIICESINDRSSEIEELNILVLQFEEGEEEIATANNNINIIAFDKEDLELREDHVANRIYEAVKNNTYDEVWVEWNGMEAFSTLERIFLQLRMQIYCHIEKVIYLASTNITIPMLGNTGESPITHVVNSDIAILGGDNNEKENNLKSIIHSIQPKLKMVTTTDNTNYEELESIVIKEKKQSFYYFFIVILTMSFYIMMSPIFEQMGIPVNTVITVFTGIILQGIPFLIIGVLLSSFIQLFVSKEWMQRIFPKNPITSILVAIITGFFLPVCDCASIPVFRTLVKKGVPLPAAITFMTVTPVINPVVILSTFYAFNGDWNIVLLRGGLGIITALIIGLTFFIKTPEFYYKDNNEFDYYCNCGCEDIQIIRNSTRGRIQLYIRHSQLEFLQVGKYLMIGAFLSAILQNVNLDFIKRFGDSNMPIALLGAMVLAFILSLCSSSDAVIARSMTGIFSFAPIMGFLVFGPMMDIKNLMMLMGGFQKKFILRLLIVAFSVCFLVILLFGLFVKGGVNL